MMFSCVFVIFPCGVLCQVWYLIVSIPDLCILPYFIKQRNYLRKIVFVFGRLESSACKAIVATCKV